MERPVGFQLEVEHLAEGIEAYEDVENVHLWCLTCGLIATYGTHVRPEILKVEGDSHVSVFHPEEEINYDKF